METINGITQWLNANAGMMQVVFAAAVASFTGIYVYYTKAMWAEMRRTNERMERPNVEAAFEPNPIAFGFYDLVVRNAGMGPVHDVRLKLDSNHIRTVDNEPLDGLALFKQPIPVLLEGREHRSLAFSLLGKANDPAMTKPVTLSVSYVTPAGKACEQSVTFDPKIAYAQQGLGQETVNDIGRYIKSISETMKEVVKSVNRVEGSVDYAIYLLPRQHDRPPCPDITLRAFERAWRDFRSVAFCELGLYQLRIQCHATYDALCGATGCSGALEEIRRTLLQMLHHHYRYMDDKVGDRDFVRLGDSVVATIAGILHTNSEAGSECTEQVSAGKPATSIS